MSAPTPHSSDNKNKRPTALVAGGAGFIGSYLVRALLSQNFHVVCVDNLSRGKKENLKEVLTAPNLTFLQEDINNPHFKLPSELKIDYVFHLASSEDFEDSVEFSLDTLLVNSLGTRALLEIAKANGAKFILLSAADLYSGAISSSSLRYYFGKSPDNETVLSLHEAKRFAEALTFEYYKKYELPVTILRLKDVYGPKMNFESGDEMARLIGSALKRENLKIHGDGLQTLNPTYISDVVFGIVKAAVGNFNGDIFILVNPEKTTIESFSQNLKLVAGPLEIEHKKDDSLVEIPFTHLDLDNTKEKLGWNPKVNLAEGLSSILQNERLIGQSAATMDPSPVPLELSVPPTVVVAKEKQSLPSTQGSKWIRPAVFVVSLLLLLVTIIYPISAAAINSWWGTSSLTNAANSLQAQNIKTAQAESLSAQNSFEGAAASVQNISWLSKIVGLSGQSANFDQLLQAGANLSEAISSASAASDLLVKTASRDTLNSDEAIAALNKVVSNLYTSKDKLEQTQLLLALIDWNKLPGWIVPPKGFIADQTTKLQDQVDKLLGEIEKLL